MGRRSGLTELGAAQARRCGPVGGSSPDNDGTGRHRQTARVRQARRRGVRVQEPVVEPPKVERRLEPDGCGPVSGAHGDGVAVGVTSVRSRIGRAGGHGEVLRGSRGEAAGEELGAYPVEREAVNVGTIPRLPSILASQAGRGQAHRRLMVAGWGGAAVVVRGRESRPHGQGRQRVRSRRIGRPGGRW